MIEEFMYYINEREAIRVKKERGEPRPWTSDEILNTYKFTNVRRKDDWTTRKLNEIYKLHADKPEAEALFMCGVFRYFGTVDWAKYVGWQSNTHFLLEIADEAIERGIQIFTGAYVVTNGGRSEPKQRIVVEYLEELFKSASGIVAAIEDSKSWYAGYKLLNRLPGFGGLGFMAKEVLQDYLLWMDHKRTFFHNTLAVNLYLVDYFTFTPVGPGARRGLNRLHGRPLLYRQSEMAWTAECAALARHVNSIWKDGLLSAHDIQFCLCEFDKYQRVKLGEGRPRSLYRPRDAHLYTD